MIILKAAVGWGQNLHLQQPVSQTLFQELDVQTVEPSSEFERLPAHWEVQMVA